MKHIENIREFFGKKRVDIMDKNRDDLKFDHLYRQFSRIDTLTKVVNRQIDAHTRTVDTYQRRRYERSVNIKLFRSKLKNKLEEFEAFTQSSPETNNPMLSDSPVKKRSRFILNSLIKKVSETSVLNQKLRKPRI